MNINKSDGWVKIHRTLTNHHIAHNTNSLAVFTLLISWAHHEDNNGSVRINGKQSHLKRGQLVVSRSEIAEHFKLPSSTVRNTLERLKEDGMIKISTDKQKSIITICNYAKYQGDEDRTRPRTTKGQAEGQVNSSVKTEQEDKGVVAERTTRGQREDNVNLSQKNKEIKKKEITPVDETSLQVLNPKQTNQLIKQDGLGSVLTETFETTFGLQLSRPAYQRAAGNELIRTRGLNETEAMIAYARSIQGERYAPQILSLEDLRDKWNKLIAYKVRGGSNHKKRKVTVITDEGNDF